MDNHHVEKAECRLELTNETPYYGSIPILDSVFHCDPLIIQESTNYPGGKEGCEIT